jgi:Flp pilus assembly protein TadD
LFEVNDAIEAVPGSAAARKLLVRRGLEYLNRLASEGGDEAALRHDLIRGYLRLGDLQGHFTPASLADDAGAQTSYRSALALAREAVADDPRDLQARADLEIALKRLGRLTEAGADPTRDTRSR